MKIALLITGDEILKGDLKDSNSHYLIQQIADKGLRVEKVVVLGDNLNILAQEIKILSQDFDLLIINGGLGPTVDDYTSEALSIASNSPLVINKKAKKLVEQTLKNKGRKITPIEEKQAKIPEIAVPIFNKLGIAPGIFLEINHCKIFSTPGVPKELYSMFQEEISPQIKNESYTKTLLVRCFGIAESQLEEKTSQYLKIENDLKLGFRAYFPYVDVKLTCFHKNKEKILKKKHQELENLLQKYSFISENLSLEEKIVKIFREKKKKLTFAESCTGGLISSKITSVSGSSNVFQSGFVLYQNQQKLAHGVSEKALSHGSVSQEVVSEMLLCSLSKAKSDFGASVSGIAGPLGGTKNKPVGTVWIAWGSKKKINTKRFFIPRERKEFQILTSYLVLDLLRREILNLPQLDFYSFEKRK